MSNIIQFGTGQIWLNPVGGNQTVNPTPTKGLTIQDFEMDLNGELKELRGQYQFPDDVARGDIKTSFKFSIGRIDYSMIANAFFGDTIQSGGTAITQTVATVIPATPYTITPTVPGAGTFGTDLGVINAANGAEFTRLPSGTPAAGQYTQAAGVYTFSSADHSSNISVIISYSYVQGSGAIGNTFQVNNQIQGYGPSIELWVADNYQLVSGVGSVIHLYAAKIGKVGIKAKRNDYSMVDFEGMYYAAASGRVADFFSNV
jgi:hypothetical protein